MDNVGLQAGWLWNTDDADQGLYASIDYFGRLFEDLKLPDPTTLSGARQVDAAQGGLSLNPGSRVTQFLSPR
jgi:hypothetical protein